MVAAGTSLRLLVSVASTSMRARAEVTGVILCGYEGLLRLLHILLRLWNVLLWLRRVLLRRLVQVGRLIHSGPRGSVDHARHSGRWV